MIEFGSCFKLDAIVFTILKEAPMLIITIHLAIVWFVYLIPISRVREKMHFN